MKYLIFLLFVTLILKGQINPIEVAELNFKVSGLGSKQLYYGFEEGDEIVFSFEEEKGKKLKQIDIVKLPNTQSFSDYKTSKIENKKISVNNRAVYKFNFYNSSISKRTCNVVIKRVPKSKNTVSFNTDWEWKIDYDTTYVDYTVDSLVGYDTLYVEKLKKKLAKTDTISKIIVEKVERVHSQTAIGKSNEASIPVILPQNQYLPDANNPYKSTELYSWTYVLGVKDKVINQEKKAMNKLMSQGLTLASGLDPTGTALSIKLGVDVLSMFSSPSTGDNVEYKFFKYQNGTNYMFESGNREIVSGTNYDLLKGGFLIQLINDNFMDYIDVKVNIVANLIQKTWEDVPYLEEIVEPQYVKLKKTRMVVNKTSTRINVQQ